MRIGGSWSLGNKFRKYKKDFFGKTMLYFTIFNNCETFITLASFNGGVIRPL